MWLISRSHVRPWRLPKIVKGNDKAPLRRCAKSSVEGVKAVAQKGYLPMTNGFFRKTLSLTRGFFENEIALVSISIVTGRAHGAEIYEPALKVRGRNREREPALPACITIRPIVEVSCTTGIQDRWAEQGILAWVPLASQADCRAHPGSPN